MASDRFFVVDSEKAARMQAKVNQNPVWYYYYSYEAAESLSFTYTHSTERYGKSRCTTNTLSLLNISVNTLGREFQLDKIVLLYILYL